jgi:hypothetical protein
MKVKIGKYSNWFGPYQLAEKLCFWTRDVEDEHGFKSKPEWVHDFGEWLAHGSIEPEQKVGDISDWNTERHMTWVYKLLSWIHSKQKRTIKVRIDPWDTWSMDDTLAHIIVPMLKQLRESKHGAPPVDYKDVPEHLRPSKDEIAAYKKDGTTDEKFFERWDWVLSEMIFAFESKLDDSWEQQFESGENDLQWKKLEGGMYQTVYGPNHTKSYDWKGRKNYEKRIKKGFELFGKYYQSLWD